MKKLFVLTILLISIISSCKKDPIDKEKELIGTWTVYKIGNGFNEATDEFKGSTMTFNADKTYIYKEVDNGTTNSTWSWKDDNTIIVPGLEEGILKITKLSKSRLFIQTEDTGEWKLKK